MNGIPRRATASEVWPLRHAILRDGQPPETARFPGDTAADAAHFVVEDGGEVVGVASLLAEGHESVRADRPYRIRGMAVAEGRRGQGIGTALLSACLEAAIENGADVVWCHARLPARSLYARAGFADVAEPFVSATLGPHVTMARRLCQSPSP